jgi:membrane protein implicated in regulation of membrane protease activity
MFVILTWPLLGLLLFAFLPWWFALPLWLIILGLSVLSSWKNMRSQERMPLVIGAKAMVGDRAVVTQVANQKVEVDYRGELWQAVSDEPLSRGQEVIILRVDRLVLYVMPAPDGAKDAQRIEVDDSKESNDRQIDRSGKMQESGSPIGRLFGNTFPDGARGIQAVDVTVKKP